LKPSSTKKLFEIDVTRISYRTHSFRIHANSADEAEKIANKESANHDFSNDSECYVEYNIQTK